MNITFYGVRGSVAISGEEFQEHGGNTTCLGIELSPSEHIVFDAGTGIKTLGDKLSDVQAVTLHLFLTHHHLDHIQGFPFFKPIYNPHSTINLYSPEIEVNSDPSTLPILDQMRPPYFPISADTLPSTIKRTVLPQTTNTLKIADIDMYTQRINHPGGGLAYRVENQQGSIVFITDNELSPSSHEYTSTQEWIKFCLDADVLIHDSHYTETEINSKKNWGHSSTEDAYNLAIAANVKYLILFHHDPERTDKQINEICKSLQDKAQRQNARLKCLSAKQTMCIYIDAGNITIKEKNK